MERKPKILLFDIETAPLLSWTWGIWEQNVVSVERNWYMLSFAYKWFGESGTRVHTLPQYRLYKKDPFDDSKLIEDLWKLFDEADIIIGHNINSFDIKKANTRFIENGLMPPSNYQTIDTLRVAKKYFGFTSNKLMELQKRGYKYTRTGTQQRFQCKACHSWSSSRVNIITKKPIVK